MDHDKEPALQVSTLAFTRNFGSLFGLEENPPRRPDHGTLVAGCQRTCRESRLRMALVWGWEHRSWSLPCRDRKSVV